MKLTWLGHSAFHAEIAGKSVLIDPFLTGNPRAPEGFLDSLDRVDFLVLTHGHEDHLGDSDAVLEKFNPTLVTMYEIAMYYGSKGHEKVEPMNIGGSVTNDGLTFTMVNAQHSSAFMEAGKPVTMGDPAGMIIKAPGEKTLYHAGDTEVFSDMALIQRIHEPKIGLIPMGDRFTMGPDTAALACNEFLNLETIVPIHWGTMELLTGDPEDFKKKVTRGEVTIATPGQAMDL
ncbi:metal-dependent hydrolase [Rhodovibrio salinarum]|nr:metal-dependent hydrolase [Rhodovibrio salinarum]